MINQFRKIKKTLMSEGKFVKYLLYIVGEILLVALGILIALQVDNWDKDQDNRKFERQYYQSMKTELLEDKKALVGEIEYGELYKKQYNTIRLLILLTVMTEHK